MGFKEDFAKGLGVVGRGGKHVGKVWKSNTESHVRAVTDYATSTERKKGKSTPKPVVSRSTPKPKALGRRTQPGDLGPGGIDYTSANGLPPAAPVAEQPDPLQAIIDQLTAQSQADVGAGPNLNDYIGQYGPARENALKYQGAATGQINAGTAALLQKLQQVQATGAADVAATNAGAHAQTAQVQTDQAAAAAKAAADLQAQGVSAAPLQAQQQQLGGQLASTAANQEAFAAQLAAIAQTEAADRAAGANTMGTGAIGQLGLNTQQQLAQLNVGEANARRQYGQDSAQHAAAASSARLKLAQQVADLGPSTGSTSTSLTGRDRALANIAQYDNVAREHGALQPGQASRAQRFFLNTAASAETQVKDKTSNYYGWKPADAQADLIRLHAADQHLDGGWLISSWLSDYWTPGAVTRTSTKNYA